MIKNLLYVLPMMSVVGFSQYNSNEYSPAFYTEANSNSSTTTTEQTTASGDRAFWTIQLDVAPTTINAGLAACYWTGTEFWVAKWGNDSIYTLNAAGVMTDDFVIAGITGTRSITSDGTDIYIGANTNQIFKVNKTTKTLTSTITTSVANVRYLTYDPGLNSGAGGFWAGTWTTDWTAVSMTGTTLSTIPAATHTMTSMYGMAYDGVTPSGPYLWSFDQTATGTGATISQHNMDGSLTGLSHNTQTDLTGSTNTGLAGGLWVASNFSSGVNSIGGISQGVSLFAYQIDDLLAIQQQNNMTLSIYPNPTQNVLTIQINSIDVDKIVVYSVNGAIVYTSTENSKQVDVSNLQSGVYMIEVTTPNGIATSRFVKE